MFLWPFPWTHTLKKNSRSTSSSSSYGPLRTKESFSMIITTSSDLWHATAVGADAELIDSLPKLEIVATCSAGLDKIDLVKCKEKGIQVTNTPDVLTDDVADAATGLTLAVLRSLWGVKMEKWDYMLTTKVCGLLSWLITCLWVHFLLGLQFKCTDGKCWVCVCVCVYTSHQITLLYNCYKTARSSFTFF